MISINIINSVNIINIMSCLDRQDEPTSHRNLHLSLSFCREVLAHVWVEIIIIIILPPMAQSSFHWVLILIHGRFSCTCSWRKIFTTIEQPVINGQVGQSSEVKLSTRSVHVHVDRAVSITSCMQKTETKQRTCTSPGCCGALVAEVIYHGSVQ